MKLKKSNRYVKNTMEKAREVQARYAALGAPSTQNVRNPIPMHQLIFTVLPVLPKPNDWVRGEIHFTVNGKDFISKNHLVNTHENLLGKEFYRTNGVSVDEVVARLQAKGFMVTRGNVAVTLTIAKMRGKIQSVQLARLDGQMGKPQSRYFAVSQ